MGNLAAHGRRAGISLNHITRGQCAAADSKGNGNFGVKALGPSQSFNYAFLACPRRRPASALRIATARLGATDVARETGFGTHCEQSEARSLTESSHVQETVGRRRADASEDSLC
jgi:hypothetical protein